MKNESAAPNPQPVRFERTYDGPVDDLWDLWTTMDGFESWWGPEGFRVKVSRIEPRVGGRLDYDMIATRAEEIAYMQKEGWAVRHGTHGTFVELEPKRRLKLRHRIDFIPGVEPYDNDMVVELVPEGARVRMVVEIEPHRDEQWTRMSAQGFESQLTKVPAALAARRSSSLS
ncbi:SRPBCC family protein [Anaeromyxobacter soli]|uniref:SRPBCC family protein n=1 Tax=Anaeromyxobacter soli TaxID=2922725 RepID=UPI001FAEC76A|nr:SRPBCC domain-containing protein [Anaeromyxobacter sp. SG29]